MLTTLTWSGLGVLVTLACICGAVGTALSGRGAGGLVVSILLALLGAVIGPWLAREFHVAELINLRVSDQPFPLISSAIGAAIAVTLLHLSSGPRLLRN
jgi:uncharacterized membrane protein YeaQ/YmgE (transglycosylase-associated protein family)